MDGAGGDAPWNTLRAGAASPRSSRETFAFDCFVLDMRRYQLRRNGRLVKVEPKPLELLACLARRSTALVSVDDLLDEVWPRLTVSRSAVHYSVLQVRRALGDTQQRLIQTVRGRGYRLAADVDWRQAPLSQASVDDSLEPRSELMEVTRQVERWLKDGGGLVLVGEPDSRRAPIFVAIDRRARRAGTPVLWVR